jgi:hypothetical protein
LYKEFEKVTDGRNDKGKRYQLALVLTLIMLGKLNKRNKRLDKRTRIRAEKEIKLAKAVSSEHNLHKRIIKVQ